MNYIEKQKDEIKQGFLLGKYNENDYPKFSNKNSKTGVKVLVINMPRITCPFGVPCYSLCYAGKGNLNTSTCQKNAYRNLKAYIDNPKRFFGVLESTIKFQGFDLVRYHESGDIDDLEYLEFMVKTANSLQNVEFVCYTKQYEIVLKFLIKNGKFPRNLHIYLSEWNGYKSFLVKYISYKYGIPRAIFIEKGKPKKIEDGKVCACSIPCGACKWCYKIGKNVGFIEHR